MPTPERGLNMSIPSPDLFGEMVPFQPPGPFTGTISIYVNSLIPLHPVDGAASLWQM